MINGVPTFSDGSSGVPGRAGSIPRTMTDADIKALGARLPTVPAATLTRPIPAFNSTDSEANIAARMRGDQGPRFGVTPAMDANAELAAVANQDPRTTLGRAALNASRRAGAASTVLQRKAALGDLAGLGSAVAHNATAALDNASATQRANITANATLRRQGLANQGGLAQQRLANEGHLADTDLAGQYDVAGRIAQANARTALTQKDLNDEAIKLLPQVMGIDPITSMIKDPSAQGGMRPATPQEIAEGIQRARAIIRGQLAPRSTNAIPNVGAVVGGYRFKGGNPNDKTNWEKV
jgi:hypothetical protein